MSRQVNFASNCENNVPRRCCKSFISTKAQELVQQTTAENAGKQVELEEAGSFRTFFIVFRLELRNPTTWLAVPVSMTYMHTTESPICLGNHEAKARAHQLEEEKLLTEEKYKELQVGQCVEC